MSLRFSNAFVLKVVDYLIQFNEMIFIYVQFLTHFITNEKNRQCAMHLLLETEFTLHSKCQADCI